MDKEKLEETIKSNLENLSLTDLKVIQSELRLGAFPRVDNFELLHIAVNREITIRIYRIAEFYD